MPQGKKADIDPEEVEKLALLGCTMEEIAAFVGVTARTLYRKSSLVSIIKKGHKKRKVALRRAQWRSAVEKGNVTMQIWLGKQELGQVDRQEIDVKTALAMYQARVIQVVREVSPELAERIISALEATQSGGAGGPENQGAAPGLPAPEGQGQD